MQTNIKQIMKATHCNGDQARNVEQYIDKGNMLDWQTANLGMINTISRAVYAKLLRDAPAKKVAKVKVTVTKPKKPSFGRQEAPEPPRKKASKAPQAGTKIAHAMEVYKAMEVDGVRSSRKDIISAIANSMQIEPQKAAGYYQNCKKKLGE